LADVAFLGGTLAPRGGHNVVEPLRAGLPTLHGPSIANVRTTLEAAREAVRLVPDEAALAPAVLELLRDPAARARAADAAARPSAPCSGATARAAERTLELLESAS